MRELLLSVLLLGMVPGVGSATQASVRIRKADLPRTAISAGDLRMTIKGANAGLFGGGPYFVEIEVENAGSSAAPFDPRRLSFVHADGRQIDVLGMVQNPDTRVAAREFLVIGGARSKQTYVMNGKLELPSKVYYDGKLIAELVE